MVSSSDRAQLGTELLRLALKQVESSYRDLNQSLFRGKLRMPVLEWTDNHAELGVWTSSARCLRLSRSLLDGPWGMLIEVLKHEMAHQYVDEVLGERGEGPHGATFRRVCAERGIDSRAAGRPDNQVDPNSAELGVLARIAALLSLAQSDNQHEAEAAMAAARRLMLKYNLEEAVRPHPLAYSFRHLGAPTGRRVAWQRVLASILGDYFFVDVIIVPVYRPREGKRGSVLEIMGSVQNLEMAAYVHDFLEGAAQGLWRAHKRAQAIDSDRHRQSFLFGVMCGFRDKLQREGAKAKREGLVWLGDPALKSYSRSRHPHVRSVAASGRVEKSAFSAGREAGASLVLHRGVGSGASAKAPRLLGSGRENGGNR